MRIERKKIGLIILVLLSLIVGTIGCARGKAQIEQETTIVENQEESQKENEDNPQEEHRILIAYFTRLDNTDGEIDTIIQGGGPYGAIGDSLEEADIDAISSASITVRDGIVRGNTQTIAEMIQEMTGGDLFSIQVEDAYPVEYNALIDAGEEENAESERPALSSHVENMEDYDIVFLGFPNWWYDMPMPVYSFLEEHDFSGKTVVPFATSAGSGFSDTISSIESTLPDSNVEEDGFHVQMNSVGNAQPDVEAWLTELEEKWNAGSIIR